MCSCVDLVSGFVRDAIAARNCSTNANVQRRGYVGQQPAVQSWQRQGSTKQQSQGAQIKAEGRVIRLGGMKSRADVSPVGTESNQNPHETSQQRGELIQTRRPYFPQDRPTDVRRPPLLPKFDGHQNWLRTRCGAFACRERVEGAQQRSTHFSKGTGRAVLHATRAPADHPIGYWRARAHARKTRLGPIWPPRARAHHARSSSPRTFARRDPTAPQLARPRKQTRPPPQARTG